MTSDATNSRWAFTLPTSLGDSHVSYEVTDTALLFESDDPFAGGRQLIAWASIREGGTAGMQGMGGRGAPDLPSWIPGQLEWLLLSRTDSGAASFMGRLPPGPQRNALVACIRGRLGPGWIGENVPLGDAQKRLGITSSSWSKLGVAGLVVGVMASLVGLLVVVAFLLNPFISVPVGMLFGGWLLRKGVRGYFDSQAAAGVAGDKVGTARRGLAQLQGLARTQRPTMSAITARPCVWWDVTVDLLQNDGEQSTTWRTFAARHDGAIDVVELEDDTGRLPVWLKGAELLLQRRMWESTKDTLPPGGLALLDEIGFAWHGRSTIRVSEQSLACDATLYVLGTIDERRNVVLSPLQVRIDRVARLLRTGEWKRMLVAAVPRPARVLVAVLIGYLEMMTQLGTAKDRSIFPEDSPPPSIDPGERMIWKGSAGRPLLVSDQPKREALDLLRKRSMLYGGFGALVIGYLLYQVAHAFAR